MNELKIINGTDKKQSIKDKTSIYTEVFERFLEKNSTELSKPYKDMDKDILKQCIYLHVKYVNASSRTYRNDSELSEEAVISRFNLIRIGKDMLSLLTPKELVNMFPIEKVYNGEKFQMKDYFSTIEALKEYNENEMIGSKILNLLFDYSNIDITLFNVNLMSSTSDMCKINGEKTPMEKFAEDNNIPTYSYNKEHNYMVNNQTGKLSKVKPCKKRVPKNIKIINGGKNNE